MDPTDVLFAYASLALSNKVVEARFIDAVDLFDAVDQIRQSTLSQRLPELADDGKIRPRSRPWSVSMEFLGPWLIIELPEGLLCAVVESNDRSAATLSASKSTVIDAYNRRQGLSTNSAEALHRVSSSPSADLMQKMYQSLNRLVFIVGADAASVLLRSGARDELVIIAAVGPVARFIEGSCIPYPRGLGWQCVLEQRVIVSPNEAGFGRRHYRDIDARSGYTTRSLICAPMDSEGIAFGCLELLNPRSGAFSVNDVAVVAAEAKLLAVVVAPLAQAKGTGFTTALP